MPALPNPDIRRENRTSSLRPRLEDLPASEALRRISYQQALILAVSHCGIDPLT